MNEQIDHLVETALQYAKHRQLFDAKQAASPYDRVQLKYREGCVLHAARQLAEVYEPE